MGFSFFPRDSITFVKKIVEKIRAERDAGSHQVALDLHNRVNFQVFVNHRATRAHLDQKTDDNCLSFFLSFFQEFDFLQHMISTQKNDGIYAATSHSQCTRARAENAVFALLLSRSDGSRDRVSADHVFNGRV